MNQKTNNNKDENSLLKIIFRSTRRDVLLGVPFIPLYALAELCFAGTIASLFQLFYVQTPRVAVADLLPKNLQSFVSFGQTLDRKDLAFIIPLILIGIGFVKMVSGFASTYLLERAGHTVARTLRFEFLNAYLQSTGEVLDKKNKDATANQLFADTALLQGFLSRGSLSILRDALLVVAIFLSMIWLAPMFMLFSIVFIVPIGILFRKIYGKIQYYARESILRQVDISTRTLQTKRGVLTIFAQRLQKRELYDLSQQAEKYYQFIKKSFALRTGFRPTVELIAIIILALLTQYQLTMAGSIEMATYSSVFMLAAFAFRPCKNIANIVSQWAEVRVVLSRLTEEWNKLLSIRGSAQHKDLVQLDRNTCAKLENVTYHVDGRDILNNITLSIPRGARVAFVGESGAGKSTALRVLCGLLTSTAGVVRIDPSFLLATQEPYLFRGTVRENIVYAAAIDEKSTRSDDKIADLMLQLGLVHSVSGVQFFRDKKLGFMGDGLSGGEKARVSLARTLYAGPDVLLLDEPTANLDSANSVLFWKAVDAWKRFDSSRTVIAVSHAISEVLDFDLAFVFQDGELKAFGPPKSVLSL